jgi:ParB family chromosome partitioning protein
MTRKVLGKGLEALIPDIEDKKRVLDRVSEVHLDKIEADPGQPRTEFSDEELAGLADSIARHGVIQPIVVRKMGDAYMVVVGERRVRAARIAGLESIPAVVRQTVPEEALEMALVENLQRVDLNPIEQANAFKILMSKFRLTQAEAAEKVGKDRSTIANFLRLLELPREVQDKVSRGTISMGHARALLSVENPERQIELAMEIEERGLSVRDTERLVAVDKRAKKKSSGSTRYRSYIHEEEVLQRLLGTKVKVVMGARKGHMRIELFSEDEATRVLELLVGALADAD